MYDFLKLVASPLVLFIAGIHFTFRPPMERNNIIGFRTKLSSRTDDTWKFANNLAGKFMLVLGGGLIVIMSISYFLYLTDIERLISFAAHGTVLSLLITIIFVQVNLKNNFTKDGLRK
ncbi:SdpI family protein [Candidatus Contubernalis alkaliaceticus]|uniref:SdpI family protein n=1 Tax=Candidatus Contubernalis alkaliaceticus TaxID=338645 RepID=UPI001F4C4D41|nr:SdpI family protein [Candidatus Contubernalis alkalaceticus]UNC92828.1 SdpI family protein [Candidatus Contubernalis alkalaceticus]